MARIQIAERTGMYRCTGELGCASHTQKGERLPRCCRFEKPKGWRGKWELDIRSPQNPSGYHLEIVLATRNPSKAEQIRALFSSDRFIFKNLDEAGVVGNPSEDFQSTLDNAVEKGLFAWQQVFNWVLADDTALHIDALGGEPGPRAARWAGEKASTEEIMLHTLKKLQGYSLWERTATFVTSAFLVRPNGSWHHSTGKVKGVILEEPRCPCQPGMPYSAIFKPDRSKKVWAEMTVGEENAISHRGQAFRQIKDHLMFNVFSRF